MAKLLPLLTVDYQQTINEPSRLSSLLTRLIERLGWFNNSTVESVASRHPTPNLNDDSFKKTKIVCISDTHGYHRSLTMPDADILIHAGDYTLHGDLDHAKDFNDWLGELPYRYKIVVHGNHEYNAPWKKTAKDILSNAVLLDNESFTTEEGLTIHGTGFFWKCGSPEGTNPYFDSIPSGCDVVVAHNPAAGYADGRKRGCPALLNAVTRARPRVVVSGHIHEARGVARGRSQELKRTLFVNAAAVSDHQTLARQATLVIL